ncbi:tetratricopeptide repeat protein [Plebeiibacterium marinum]|uniref:Tetratricopeptide repeat protein n=1 Tax=Plebeiibacterium marinum TaxID=2992111 RepID=A0AAE3SLG7_9BACT|nr:tetratricopeptide repeat protein [Plebeiobacterium marinum]MCW3807682.1 tetratricopeptide repeat protein [Plebeiobacterium marinum]
MAQNQSEYMQEYSHADQEGTREAIDKFEELIHFNQESYFDVFQIESIFDYYHEKSQIEKAEKAICMGLKQHPDSTSLQLRLSTLYIEQYKDEEALTTLNFLKEVENNNSEVFLNLGIIYTRAHEIENAISNFEIALKLCSEEDLADYVFEISFNLNQESYYEHTKNLVNYYLKVFPRNENILFELAYAHDKLDEIDNGIEVYNKLLDINPYLENAWYNIGILFNKKENFTQAIEAYEITIAIAPNLPEAYFNKANSLAQTGDYTGAINSYTEYLSYSFPNAITYYYMGDCWENIGNFYLASKFYKAAVKIDPEHMESLQSLGRTSYKVQDYETSIFAFDKAVSIDPKSSDLWRALGKSYKKLKKPAEAKRCLKRALINQHQDTKNWIEMYQFLSENETEFNEVPFIELLLSKDQTNGAIHYLAAIIYNQANKQKESLKHLVIARQILPEDLELVLNKYPSLVAMPEIAEYINTQL